MMQWLHYDTIDSTNDEAQRLLAAGRIRGPACIVARSQHAGRGTRGRRWASPLDAGIYATIVDPSPPGGRWAGSAYTRAAGVAIAQALAEATGCAIRLKPVNDLFVADGKLGGVLVEAAAQNGRITSIITGVGINLKHVPLDVNDVRRDGPTPVALEVQRPGRFAPIALEAVIGGRRCAALNVPELIDAVARRILHWNDRVARGRLVELDRAWTAFSAATRTMVSLAPPAPARATATCYGRTGE